MSVEAVSWVLRGGPYDGTIEVPSSRQVGRATVWAVLVVIAEHARPDGSGACPSQETIARECGVERRTVRHALAELERAGIIVKRSEAKPRVRGAVYDIPAVSGVIARQSDPQPEEQTQAGYPATVDPNSGGHSGGHSGGVSGGIPRHEPEPEPELVTDTRHLQEDDPDRKLTLDEIRTLRTQMIPAGRAELDHQRELADARRRIEVA